MTDTIQVGAVVYVPRRENSGTVTRVDEAASKAGLPYYFVEYDRGPADCPASEWLGVGEVMARPQPLTVASLAAPDRNRFPWGPIVKVHRIGDYAVVEYLRDSSQNLTPRSWVEHGRTSFHPYVVDRDTSHAFSTLEEAIVFAIAYARAQPRAQRYFELMTRGVIPGEETS